MHSLRLELERYSSDQRIAIVFVRFLVRFEHSYETAFHVHLGSLTRFYDRDYTLYHIIRNIEQFKTVPPIIAVLLPCDYFYRIEQFCSCRENRRYPGSLAPELISALISLLMNIHSTDAICEFALSIA